MPLPKKIFIGISPFPPAPALSPSLAAFGAFNGKISHLTASELGGIASTAAIADLPKGTPIDSVNYGNVLQTSRDAAYLSRHVGLRAGLPITVPANTINRLCGSGFQAIVNSAQDIFSGDAEISLAGGTENMSQAPYVLRGIRTGTRYGVDQPLEDSLAHGLVDQYPVKTPMGITAENLAKKYNISREDADAFALVSQQRWADAQKSKRFATEIVPIEIKSKKGTESFETDEHARPQTTIESLKKLSSVFIKETGTVTAGNASGISDGAASLVIASEDAVKKYNLKPLAEVLSWSFVGVDPSIMGIGPVPAIREALKRAKLSLNDMSLVEVNEAFASQFLAVEKELGLNRAITNSNGGAIALGHPLGASGARIMTHLSHELHRTNGKYAIGSACIGGGQGIAVVIERC
ncbi:3-ketoacyl-CoA thiolase, mitochondrial [Entophlyctis luteolus]|nr:3-ketoacyl-CoA thiolase, mitochondrial [Entophlyctis luteolus]KAJ3347332.1 3-ketoacyl-CoA thiolase, mitochondrial [Entophlyctis luteolus]KAJ3387924.1 3-ketoacyl-CoA thiolase, mitochondrial [Entophlyctis sp. JEL0112]